MNLRKTSTTTLASFCQPKLRSWKMAGPPNLCTAHGQPNAVGGKCETRRLRSQDDVLMTYVWVCWVISAMLRNSVLYSNFGISKCARVSQVPRLPIHVLKGIYQTYMEDPHDETWEIRNVRRHTLVRISSSIYPSLSHLKAAAGILPSTTCFSPRRDQQVCFPVPEIDSIVSNLQKHWDVFLEVRIDG